MSNVPTPPPPPPPVAPAPKKGKSIFVWIALGCGVIIVLAVLVVLAGGYFIGRKITDFAEQAEKNPALATAKLVAAANPDVEIVSEDEEKGTLTLRNKKTGELITLDAEEIKEGRIKFRNEKGEEVTFGSTGEGGQGGISVESKEGQFTFGGAEGGLPGWVPVYSGVQPQRMFAGQTAEAKGGAYHFQTSDSVESVIEYYENELRNGGFEVQNNSVTQDGQLRIGVLVGTNESDRRTVSVNASPEGGQTKVMLTYEEKPAAGGGE